MSTLDVIEAVKRAVYGTPQNEIREKRRERVLSHRFGTKKGGVFKRITQNLIGLAVGITGVWLFYCLLELLGA